MKSLSNLTPLNLHENKKVKVLPVGDAKSVKNIANAIIGKKKDKVLPVDDPGSRKTSEVIESDLENLAVIEEKIGIKLKRYEKGSLFSYAARQSYHLDKSNNIIWLNLWDCGLSDISFLKLLPNLTQINLNENKKISDYSILWYLPNLTHLYLHQNNIVDIYILKHLQNLIRLDLGYNQITDISSLRRLPNLTHISLNNNKINDISVLKYLKNLTQLDLSHNKITDISILKYLPNLTQLDLRYNMLNDISILEDLKTFRINLKIKFKEGVTFFPDKTKNLIQTQSSVIGDKLHATNEAYLKSLEDSEKQARGEVKELIVSDGDSGKTSEVIERMDKIETDSEAKSISDEELIKRIKKSDKIIRTTQVTTTAYVRNEYVSEFAKRKAKGICQLCENFAPFNDSKGKPYLESHHVIWLSRGGDDSVENVIALCPNCHAKIHELDIESDVEKLKRKAMENSKV